MGVKNKHQLMKEQALNKKERYFKRREDLINEKNKPEVEKILERMASLQNTIRNCKMDLTRKEFIGNQSILRKLDVAIECLKKLELQLKREETKNGIVA